MSHSEKPFVLSIAGFDPSAGAGLLSDIKVFEMHGVQGLGVCTSITFQNEKEFEGLNWLSTSDVIRQMEILLKLYDVEYVKIGLVKGLKELNTVIDVLLKWNKETKVIWDPILKASAGYDFHNEIEQKTLTEILKKIYLITPNLDEITKLVPDEKEVMVCARKLSENCIVYLKGGHIESKLVKDMLFLKSKVLHFENERIEQGEKHGSGCVLSSSLTANLAAGLSLEASCEKAIAYTRNFLKSNKTLLGYHNN